MPFYDLHSRPREWHEEYARKTRAMWEEVAQYVRAVDPYDHPITAHPSVSARDSLSDGVLDFDMLQTGHGDRASLPNTVQQVVRSYSRQPVMPVVEGEVCYEGIGEASRQEVQRMMFWACWLNGAKGFTYGANGIWQVNTREKPYGASPHGMAWGDTPWEEAYCLPGSAQLGMAKRLLERYEWRRIEPHPEWVEPQQIQMSCSRQTYNRRGITDPEPFSHLARNQPHRNAVGYACLPEASEIAANSYLLGQQPDQE